MYALPKNNTGEGNTAFGGRALLGITSGSGNTVVGNFYLGGPGDGITSGNNNIVIGSDVSIANGADSGQLSIGNVLYGTGMSGKGRMPSAIGIMTTAPTSTLQVNGSFAASTINSSTGVTTANLANAYTAVLTSATASFALPDATTCNGRVIIIANYSGSAVTITRVGGNTINWINVGVTVDASADPSNPTAVLTYTTVSSSSYSLGNARCMQFVASNGKWYKIN